MTANKPDLHADCPTVQFGTTTTNAGIKRDWVLVTVPGKPPAYYHADA